MEYITSTNPNAMEYRIEKGEAELKDLERFWDYLSWWERDESMAFAQRDSVAESYNNVTEDIIIRSRNVLEKIKELDRINEKNRPSKLKATLEKIVKIEEESYKPNYRICLSILTNLPNKEFSNFDKYLDIEEQVALNGRSLKLYEDIALNQTRAIFFAFRNYLGKLVER